MSEILKKYKEKTEYLTKFVMAYQKLTLAILGYLKIMVKGSKALTNDIVSLEKRLKAAKNIFQIQAVGKDFLIVAKKVDAFLKNKHKAKSGGLFGGIFGSLFSKNAQAPNTANDKRKPGEGIDLIDKSKEILLPYTDLLEELCKGALLLADDRESFYSPLRSQRTSKFQKLNSNLVDSLRWPIYNFFINKSNEAGLVENEREELKKIISTLTGYIQSLSVSSDRFGAKLDEYAQKVTQAADIEEIKKLKSAILGETLKIKKENSNITERLHDSEKGMRIAGEKIARLEKELQMAREKKSVDALTQLFNRGYFDERLQESVTQYERTGDATCLIMFDVDHFKNFNDSFGHQAGDQVLRIVAELTKEKVRAADTVSRYGGEEFSVILYKSGIKDAMLVAEQIRANIYKHEFGIGGKTIHIAISGGVTPFKRGDSPETIIKRADDGLYEAKENGRNKMIKIM